MTLRDTPEADLLALLVAHNMSCKCDCDDCLNARALLSSPLSPVPPKEEKQ